MRLCDDGDCCGGLPWRVSMKNLKKCDKKFSIHPVSVIIWIWLFVCVGVVSALSYVLAVAVHELGHFLTAKRLGYALSRFSLSPYGVALSYFQQNLDFHHEIKIALAGPFANILSGFLTVGVWWLFPNVYVFTSSFVEISVILALLNLLPAYPLDGGRVFVATFSQFCDEKRAKKITILNNVVLSVFFMVLFVVFVFKNFNPTYLLFAFFLITGVLDLNFSTKYEKINIFCKQTKNFVKPTVCYVNPDVKIKDLLAKMQSSKTHIFCLVLENGRVVNISEKMVVNLSLSYGYDCELKDIFKTI